MHSTTFKMPSEWSRFTTHQEVVWTDMYNDTFYPKIPLLYEGANLYEITSFQPWINAKEYIPALFVEWKETEVELRENFSRRNTSKTEIPMKKGMGLLLEALYWCNGQPVDGKNLDVNALKVKPINISERLEYILLNPTKFHSFIQLSELLVEMEKLFIKQEVMAKYNPSK